MGVVDRSNTNWTPWPRLNGIAPKFQVMGGIACIMGAAAVFFKYRQSKGAPLPSTVSKEWEEATEKRSYAKEREAADPVVLNPISKSLKK